jgi:hypothetical protein
MIRSTRTAACLALALIIALAGCSSSAKKHDSSPGGAGTGSGSTPTQTSSSDPSGDPSGTPTGTPTGSGTPADAATKLAVTKAFTTFFGDVGTVAQSEAVLQHGAMFADALEEQSKGAYAQKSSASVSDVRVSGDLAYVTFTISSNGTALLPNTKGYAVRDAGTWKVAAQTFCTLLQLEGSPPAACKDSAITALPH